VANPQSCGTDLARLTGYKKVLAEHGVPFDERLVAAGDGTLEAGAQAAQRLLSLSPAPTALFCFNDMTAMGAIYALLRADRSVPRDCSVIGFDDLELSAYCSPPLTTVRQPTCRMGQRAMDLLQVLIQGRSAAKPEVLPATLVVRETTGPAPRSSRGRGRR
jgi:DNA-binding LacI/PurR family transcriptional regulator